MKAVACEHEEAVRRALPKGDTWGGAGHQLAADLELHIRGCTVCRETVRVAGVLRRAADADGRPRLPTPQQLWWKARIMRRFTEPDRRAERATRPVMWGLGIGALGAFLALLAALALGLSPLLTAFSGLDVGGPLAGVWVLGLLAVVCFPVAVVAALGLLLRDSA